MNVKPVTVGPIVGVTTPTSTRLWGRGEFASGDEGIRRCFGIARIAKQGKDSGDPILFKMLPQFDFTGIVDFTDLAPKTNYTYQMGYFFAETEPEKLPGSLGYDWTNASTGQLTTSPDDSSASLSFVFGSCRYLLRFGWFSLFDGRGDKTFRSITDQINRGSKTDLLLMCGDQIYADDLSFLFPDKYLSEFHERYADAFAQPHIRHLMSRIPTYMILDDHEIKNDWTQDQARQYAKTFSNAIQAYRSYQMVHGPAFNPNPDPNRSDTPDRFWYTFSHGCAEFFVMDTRTERYVELDPPELISQEQMSAFKQWLTDTQDTIKFVVTSVPFFPDLRAGAADKWAGFPEQRIEILDFIRENQVPRVVFLSGDTHCSTSAQLTCSTDSNFRVTSIASSPFYQPIPHPNKSHFYTSGVLTKSKKQEYHLDNVGNFYSTDNFTRVSANLHQLEIEVYGRKGARLGKRTLKF